MELMGFIDGLDGEYELHEPILMTSEFLAMGSYGSVFLYLQETNRKQTYNKRA